MPRYFFVLPDVDHPVGGVNVALNFVRILSQSGFDASVLHGQKNYTYPYFDTSGLQVFYHPPLADIPRHFMGRKDKVLDTLRKSSPRPQTRTANPNTALDIRPDDVFVLPEFWYPEYSAIFPDNPRILLAQDVFGFCQALARDLDTANPTLDRFTAICTTSQASANAVEQFSTKQNLPIQQAVDRPTLNEVTPKKRQIAYMPRKRQQEIAILMGCLKNNPAFAGWEFTKIENASPAELDRIFNESLIFLSFSYQEGFGLPPAEAMAAGCIVIGYTGVGGEEFFQSDVGLPILDGDIANFAATLEATVTEYAQTPARLDQLRLTAAEKIRTRYSLDNQRQSLLAAWASIEKDLTR